MPALKTRSKTEGVLEVVTTRNRVVIRRGGELLLDLSAEEAYRFGWHVVQLSREAVEESR